MFCSRPVLLAATLFVLGSFPLSALAQSKAAVKRAQKALSVPEDTDRLREAFQSLSDELRAGDDPATAEGWWLRGEVAAQLTLVDTRPVTMASLALDSYNEALGQGPLIPALDRLEGIEDLLTPLAKTDPERTSAQTYAAAELLLVAIEVRRRVAEAGGPDVDPIQAARVRAIAARAAVQDKQLRVARKVFLDLTAQGGFMEPLALELAEALEVERGPQQAFLFLTGLMEEHSHRRKLLIAYIELCVANGWLDEASTGLRGAVPHMKDTYDDHLFLAHNYERLTQKESAEAQYKLALKLVPKGFEANLGYAKLLASMALDLTAVPEVEEDEEDEEPPELSPESLTLVITYRRRAVSALEVGLASNPEHQEALLMLVELYTLLEDEPGAVSAAVRLAALQSP